MDVLHLYFCGSRNEVKTVKGILRDRSRNATYMREGCARSSSDIPKRERYARSARVMRGVRAVLCLLIHSNSVLGLFCIDILSYKLKSCALFHVTQTLILRSIFFLTAIFERII